MPDATQWTVLNIVERRTATTDFSHVRFQSRVTLSCQEYLQQTPAGLTSENLPGGPKPKAYNNIVLT